LSFREHPFSEGERIEHEKKRAECRKPRPLAQLAPRLFGVTEDGSLYGLGLGVAGLAGLVVADLGNVEAEPLK
jgi:hypothetical protein